MSRRPALPKDPSQRAEAVLDMATGESRKPSYVLTPAKEFARKGGLKGGKAHAVKLAYCKRYARLTLAFSKKIENHVYAFALHTMYHNFVKISGAHRMIPAQSAGVDSRLWEVSDMVKMIEEWEASSQ